MAGRSLVTAATTQPYGGGFSRGLVLFQGTHDHEPYRLHGHQFRCASGTAVPVVAVAEVAKLRHDPAFMPSYMDAEQRNAARSFVSGDDEGEYQEPEGPPFRIAINGVEKRFDRTDKESGQVSTEWRWFCSLIEIDAETRSSEGEEWGRLLRVTDRDHRVKEWAMPMSMLAGDGTAYRERLLSLGLIMAPGKFARDALHEYISTARPNVKARCVSRVGWQNKVYVRFNGNFGEQAHA